MAKTSKNDFIHTSLSVCFLDQRLDARITLFYIYTQLSRRLVPGKPQSCAPNLIQHLIPAFNFFSYPAYFGWSAAVWIPCQTGKKLVVLIFKKGVLPGSAHFYAVTNGLNQRDN